MSMRLVLSACYRPQAIVMEHELKILAQVAIAFAGMHDTPTRMVAKGVLRGVVPWARARPFFVWRLRRRCASFLSAQWRAATCVVTMMLPYVPGHPIRARIDKAHVVHRAVPWQARFEKWVGLSLIHSSTVAAPPPVPQHY